MVEVCPKLALRRARRAGRPGEEQLMMRQIKAFLRDKSAATAIEYALITAGIAIVIITVVKGIGTKLNTTFGSVSSQLN